MQQTLVEQFGEMLDERVSQILSVLPDQDPAYALAVQRNRQLYDEVSDVIEGHTELHISGVDREAIAEVLESECEKGDLASAHTYLQGYRDCVKLFQFLQII